MGYPPVDSSVAQRLVHLTEMITELREAEALSELAALITDRAASSDALLGACMAGMRRVGERFETGRYFIAALIMAGEIMRQATEMIGPRLSGARLRQPKGRIVLGTVQGDIHDLGKNLFAGLLHFDGVEVVDLGVDVSPETFLSESAAQKPTMVGLSCVLTGCLAGLRETIALLRGELGKNAPPVIIGGTCVDANVREFSKADFWAADASRGLAIYREVYNRSAKP